MTRTIKLDLLKSKTGFNKAPSLASYFHLAHVIVIPIYIYFFLIFNTKEGQKVS